MKWSLYVKRESLKLATGHVDLQVADVAAPLPLPQGGPTGILVKCLFYLRIRFPLSPSKPTGEGDGVNAQGGGDGWGPGAQAGLRT